jgi:hypothetical protein
LRATTRRIEKVLSINANRRETGDRDNGAKQPMSQLLQILRVFRDPGV